MLLLFEDRYRIVLQQIWRIRVHSVRSAHLNAWQGREVRGALPVRSHSSGSGATFRVARVFSSSSAVRCPKQPLPAAARRGGQHSRVKI